MAKCFGDFWRFFHLIWIKYVWHQILSERSNLFCCHQISWLSWHKYALFIISPIASNCFPTPIYGSNQSDLDNDRSSVWMDPDRSNPITSVWGAATIASPKRCLSLSASGSIEALYKLRDRLEFISNGKQVNYIKPCHKQWM